MVERHQYAIKRNNSVVNGRSGRAHVFKAWGEIIVNQLVELGDNWTAGFDSVAQFRSRIVHLRKFLTLQFMRQRSINPSLKYPMSCKKLSKQEEQDGTRNHEIAQVKCAALAYARQDDEDWEYLEQITSTRLQGENSCACMGR